MIGGQLSGRPTTILELVELIFGQSKVGNLASVFHKEFVIEAASVVVITYRGMPGVGVDRSTRSPRHVVQPTLARR